MRIQQRSLFAGSVSFSTVNLARFLRGKDQPGIMLPASRASALAKISD